MMVPFLRDLANSIEKQELTPKQLQDIGEFFMSYQFQEQTQNGANFSKKELIKFLSLGWYVYNVLHENDLK